MAQHPNPVLLYHPDAYDIAREDLKGRHSAGEAFLTAFLEQAKNPDIYALCLGKGSAEKFVATVKDFARGLKPYPIARTDIAVLRRQALLNLPIPDIAEEARKRGPLGDSAYALCGVTHTISSRAVLDGVANIPAAPVRPWDALVCTSHAVHAALSHVLAVVEEDLRARIGATRFTRPLTPVIPLGVHANRFLPKQKDREHWRKKLGIDDDTIAILFFGRLSVHAKTSPFQLAQAAEAAAKISGKRLAIVWCGRFHNEFQRHVFMETAKSMAPSVAFHHVDGRDDEACSAIWSAADIFCSFSDNIQESFGLTVIEAMAAGLPVVVSDWDGYRMAVEHGKNGILIDTYFPQGSLAEAGYRYIAEVDTYDLYLAAVSQLGFVDTGQAAHWLARLASDASLRKTLGAAGRKTVETSFDWKVIMKLYADLWREQKERIEQARQSAEPPSRAWTVHDPAQTFASYPSHHLQDGTRLERGSEFTRWEDIVTLPGIVLNDSVLAGQSQYLALQRLFAGGNPRTVTETLAAFAENERPAVLRSLHWLIKIGLLQLAAKT